MTFIKAQEMYVKSILEELGYDSDVQILPSSKKELGDFQINVSMSLAKKYTSLSVIGVSVLGAIFHNIGQVLIGIFLLNTLSILSNISTLKHLLQPWSSINLVCLSVVFLSPLYAVLHSTIVPPT